MAGTKGGKKKGGARLTGMHVFIKERTAELKKQYGQDTSVIDEVRQDWSALSDTKKEEYKKKAKAQMEKGEKA